MASTRSEELRALEQTRQRLFQLTQSLGSLKASVQQSPQIPDWDSLQRSSSILAGSLKSLTDHLTTHHDLFERTVVYPSTNFPGRSQEGLLSQILRKKLEPGVEAWVEEGKSTESAAEAEKHGDLEQRWESARNFIRKQSAAAAHKLRSDPYTAEERRNGIENAVTGLRKPMKMSEEDEEADEDEEMEDADGGDENAQPKKYSGPVRNMDEMVRFMTTGLPPLSQHP